MNELSLGAPSRSTLSDLAFERAGDGALPRVIVVVASALGIALAAQISFRLPITPVPYTGQTAAILLVGTVLGVRLGLATVMVYLLAGLAGAPVFQHGTSGIATLLGPTGGYLFGFAVAVIIVGRLAESTWDRRPLTAAVLMIAGNFVIYAIGVPVLAVVTGLSPAEALVKGALVFLPWDLAKVLIASLLLPSLWRMAGEVRVQGP